MDSFISSILACKRVNAKNGFRLQCKVLLFTNMALTLYPQCTYYMKGVTSHEAFIFLYRLYFSHLFFSFTHFIWRKQLCTILSREIIPLSTNQRSLFWFLHRYIPLPLEHSMKNVGDTHRPSLLPVM